MSDYSPMADDRRPSVRMLLTHATGVDLQAVFCGLEEEGIPVEVQEVPRGGAVALAKEAAHMSPLNVGIGVNGDEQAVVLHHRDLPADHPLFVVRLRDARGGELRRLGINAARLVKGEPLVLQDGIAPDPQNNHRSAGATDVPDDLVERIVQSVLAELAKA
ncbi:MAG: glycerol dehydratase reactivase beta/small subunit family protein [Candidatus Korobacteraceae bacterium]